MTASIVSGLLAVAFGILAARVEVRDNIDKIIEDLAQQGRWASMAAIFAAVAAILQAIHYFINQ